MLCFVVVLVISVALLGPMPDLGTSAAYQAAYFQAHHGALLWSAWLTFPAAAFFLWFLVGLRAYLRSAPGRQEGLPDFAFASGIVLVVLAFVGAFFQSAVVYPPPQAYVPNGLAAVYVAMIFTQSGLGWAPVAIFLFAASHSMRRHDSAPAGLALLGYFAAFTAGVASFSPFFNEPPLSPTGLTTELLGGVPGMLWLIGTGFTLLGIKESPAPS